MIFLNTPTPPAELRQMTVETFGAGVQYYEPADWDPAQAYPFLRRFGELFECRYRLSGVYRGYEFALGFPLGIFTSERNRRIHRYGFRGHILSIQNLAVPAQPVYACTGFFLRPQRGEFTVKTRLNVVTAYSNAALSDRERQTLQAVVDWVDMELAGLIAGQYILWICSGTVHICFYKPELTPFFTEIERIRNALDQGPLR